MINEDVWLKPIEVSGLLNVTDRTVRNNLSLYEYKIANTNGGKAYFINLKSLPMRAQLKYYQAGDVEEYEEPAFEPEPIKTEITEEKLKLSRAKLRVVRLYLECSEVKTFGERLKAKLAFIELFNKGKYSDLFKLVGKVSFKSLERWKKDLEDNNWDSTCLVEGYKGRSTTVTATEALILRRFLLHPNKLSYKEIYRLTYKELAKKGIKPKSVSTYMRWTKEWKENNGDIYALATGGEKALNDRHLPDLFRDYNRIEVGDIVVADGHTLNFTVLDQNGKRKRPTIIYFYDMKSSMPLGFEIDFTENTRSIANAFRRTVLMLGFAPRYAYLDNGRAFRSKYFNGVKDLGQTDIYGLFRRLGTEAMFAIPYHGQSKTVERFFGVLHEFEKWMPSYVGNKIENKPAYMRRNEKIHKALYGNTVFDIETVVSILLEWIKEYSLRKHVEGNFKGFSPMEVWLKSMEIVKNQPDYESRIMESNKLDYLMMTSEKRMIGKNGVRLFGRFYWSEELYGIKKEVIVKYDILNLEEILVYDLKGKPITRASCKDSFHPMAYGLGDIEDQLKVQEALEEKAGLKKDTVIAYKKIIGETDLYKIEPVKGTKKEPVKKTKKLDPFNCGLRLTAGDIDDIKEEEEPPIFVFESEKEEYYKKKYKN